MRYKRTFRTRFIISYVIFGLFIACILAVYIYFDVYRMDNEMIDDFIHERMQENMYQPHSDQSHTRETQRRLSLLPLENGGTHPDLENLADGFNNIEISGKVHRVYITRIQNKRYAAIYDISDYTKDEEKFGIVLIIGGLLSVVFSAWIGYVLSKMVIAPVTALADLVESSTDADAKLNLSGMFADDEMGRLAKAFDVYLLKLDQFIQREKTFTADASHELRTPLTVIKSTVEMLTEKNNLDKKDLERLQRIDRAAKDMTQCLDALLVMARESKRKTELECTNVRQVIIKSLDRLMGSVANPEVKVEKNLFADPLVDAPENIVVLLIGNVLRNAFRYTQKGSIMIALDDHSLVIKDTGIGIQAEDLAKVFERGFRGKRTIGEGSGLGLSIAKRICDFYGWSIQLESKESEGTTVTWDFSAKLY